MTLEEVEKDLRESSRQMKQGARLVDCEFSDLLDSALSHLETLKRDKERLDWMEGQTWIDFSAVGVMGLDASSLAEPCTGASYRAAIDSAMSPAPQQKGES